MRTIMRRRRLIALGMGSLLAVGVGSAYLLGRARAAGAPTMQPLTYSGVLTNTAGVPLTDASKNIQITLWDMATGGTQACSTASTATPLTAGAFQVVLPPACTTAIHGAGDLWVEVFVDGASVGRTKLGATPYAIEADHAVNADQSAAGFQVPGTLTAGNAQVTGNVNVGGTVVRKIARAHGLGPNEEMDNGAIASRVLTFTKTQAATSIRVSYTDNFSVYTPTGTAGACRWEIQFNGVSCATPGKLIYDVYVGTTFNHHRPASLFGTCSGLAAGTYNIQVTATTAPGYVLANSDCYTGWNAAYWALEAEEVL